MGHLMEVAYSETCRGGDVSLTLADCWHPGAQETAPSPFIGSASGAVEAWSTRPVGLQESMVSLPRFAPWGGERLREPGSLIAGSLDAMVRALDTEDPSGSGHVEGTPSG